MCTQGPVQRKNAKLAGSKIKIVKKAKKAADISD